MFRTCIIGRHAAAVTRPFPVVQGAHQADLDVFTKAIDPIRITSRYDLSLWPTLKQYEVIMTAASVIPSIGRSPLYRLDVEYLVWAVL